MTLRFIKRAAGIVVEVEFIGEMMTSKTFGDIGGNRERRPSDLRSQPVILLLGQGFGPLENLLGKIDGIFPHRHVLKAPVLCRPDLSRQSHHLSLILFLISYFLFLTSLLLAFPPPSTPSLSPSLSL